MQTLSRSKPKCAIDLDNWIEPGWDAIEMCLAAGFPDAAKTEAGKQMMSPMLEVIAPPGSRLTADSGIVLSHAFQAPQPLGFSGISGGPIFALAEGGQPLAIGIVFEGHPSIAGQPDAPEGFLTNRDVLIRGHTVTPTIFERWHRDAFEA